MQPAGCCLHPCTEPPGRSWRCTGLQARKLPLLSVANYRVPASLGSVGEAVGVGHQAAYGQQPSPVTGNFGAARLVR